MGAYEAIWETHPNAVLGGLVLINVALLVYILKSGARLNKRINTTKGINHLKHLKTLGPSQLYSIKQLLDDKNDTVSLYAFRAIVKNNSGSINAGLLQNALFRADHKRFLLVSCLKKIAESGNARLIAESINADLPEWIYVASLKVLAKAKFPEVTGLLVTATEHSSLAIQNAARELLDNAQTTKIEMPRAA